MIYIPVKIKEFVKDENDEKFVICDAMMNTIPLTEFRNIKKVQLDLIKVERKCFKLKSIRKGQTYTLMLFKNGNYKNCFDKKINGWGDYVFEKYENYINKEYNKTIKQRKKHEHKKYKPSFLDRFFNFDLGMGDIKIS